MGSRNGDSLPNLRVCRTVLARSLAGAGGGGGGGLVAGACEGCVRGIEGLFMAGLSRMGES